MTQVRGDIPEKIGRYEVLEAIGYGAMGAVYKGFDPIIQRPVALKTLRLDVPPSSPDYEAFVERFAGEARSVGRLSHPNIVTLYDVGTEDHPPWLAMEFVAGKTVAELLEGEKLPAEIIVGLVSQMAAAIDYAHSEGVVHRDIKPSNVIVCGDGKDKVVKVTDFGIAKLMDADATHSGIMMGTPSYMSPEQAMGEDLDGRTDIFSLGVVAFEMLSGQQPFPGNNVTSILYKLVHADPVHPENLEVLGLLPHKWHEVFSRVLAKDPRERYPTAAAFVQDLELCLGSWFGALEGETVVPREIEKKAPAAEPSDRSDETVVLSASDDADVRVEAATPLDATSTMAGGAAASKPDESSHTMRLPPPSAAEKKLYEDLDTDEPLLDETLADEILTGADETVLDAAAPPPATETIRTRLSAKRGYRSLLVGLAGVAALVVVAFLLLSGGEATDAPATETDAAASAELVPEPALPEMGSLRVVTEPEGAVVLLGGRRAGLTPIDFPQLPMDTYTVRVELDGFLPEEVTVELTEETPDATYELDLAPAPRAPDPAFLRIESEPTGAEVQVDGRTVGNTPVERVRVEPGARLVRLLLDGFLPWEDTLRAREGRTEFIRAELTPRGPVAPPAPVAEVPPPETVVPGQLVERGDPGVVDPECADCPSVPYPSAAREARLEGLVELEFLIDENGDVQDLKVVRSGGEMFDAAVLEVVRNWKYHPATKEGVPVRMRWAQRFRFQQGR